MQFPDVMVDLETGGLSMDHAPIFQIAAVRFNLLERTIDTSSMFDRCLSIPPGRYWDEGTREWWLGTKNREVFAQLAPRMEDPETVLRAFWDWLGIYPPRLWAKPSHFEHPLLDSYFKQYGLTNPFHYRMTTDVNSFIRGMARDPNASLTYKEFEGDAHNALFDVLNQIGNLFAAMEHYASQSDS